MRRFKYALIGLFPLLFSGCIFTKYEVIEVPKYITRPMPHLKTYEVNSSFKFKGLVKGQVKNGMYVNIPNKPLTDGWYILVPEQQFLDYTKLKLKIEAGLKKANDQVRIYNKLADDTIKDK